MLYHITYSDFICLFNTNNIHQIKNWCQTILEELESLNFNINEHRMINLHATITLAQGEGKALIQHLRVAQLEAKNKNLNYYFYDEKSMDIIKQQEKNIYWMDFLKQSFKDDKVVPFFQPIVDTNTGKVVKYEALARIQDGDTIISPANFIESAKQLGMITKITKTIIEKSCEVFQNSNLELSLNITKDDLVEGYLSSVLHSMTSKYNLKKSQITLEILEEISVFGNDTVIQELLKLKNDGYKIALDDFGSENASFSRMLDLKVDILKIDAMFIKNIHTDKNSKLIVEGILHIAKLFNYEVIAEYVHNKEVLDILLSMNIPYAQGYYFNPPLQKPLEL
jgi:EAL domain-containing protein (putative c-di-GMP-specific phosphodiesterase class I)